MHLMDWKKRRVLVTGAGGFIGSHLTEELLALGAHVTALVHYNSQNSWGYLEGLAKNPPRNLTVVAGDVRDAAFTAAITQKQDTLFHLAALIAIPYSYVAPQSFIETNVLGTLNMLEGARTARVRRFIQTSTSEVYGTALYVPIDEKHPLQGQSPYAASKIAADQLALSYFRSYGLPVTVVRPFNTFGPRQSARAIIPTILSSLLAGNRTLALGETRPVRDFTFVRDTARAFVAAADSASIGQVFNIGTGTGRSIADLVKECSACLDCPRPHLRRDSQRVRPDRSEVWRLIASSRLARRAIHWAPRVPFTDGLRETAHYIRQHRERYKETRYNI